jgi:putative transposase
MIDRSHALPVTRQARELGISRGSVYYLPRPTSVADLAIMRRLDELHLEHPCFGSRRLVVLLRRDGFDVGRQHVRTLMRRMGIEAIYRKPRTSLANQAHRVYPYLTFTLNQSNQLSNTPPAPKPAPRCHGCHVNV